MAKTAIAVDEWKVPTFEKLLKEAGYPVISKSKLAEGVIILKLEADDLEKVTVVVEAAMLECSRKRMH